MKDEEMAEEYAKAHIVQYPKRVIISENGFCTSEDEVKQAFLAGLKAGRPQWHDLRKDKNDLPDTDREVIVRHEDEDSEVDVYIREDGYIGWKSLRWDIEYYQRKGEPIPDFGIIMWCEIPTFDKESENYTVEQNTGENQIEGGVISISGSVSEYQPFNNCDELVECWEKKMLIPAFMFTKDERDKLYRPSIWVKSKIDGTDNLIIAFDNDNESIGGSCVFIQDIWVDMKELFDNFTFLDGSPCGVEE